jgi:hypothetical protein
VDSPKEITQLLAEVGRGDEVAADALFEKVYRELRALAKSYLRRERASGLAAAKRKQFLALHGHLFCEAMRDGPEGGLW